MTEQQKIMLKRQFVEKITRYKKKTDSSFSTKRIWIKEKHKLRERNLGQIGRLQNARNWFMNAWLTRVEKEVALFQIELKF